MSQEIADWLVLNAKKYQYKKTFVIWFQLRITLIASSQHMANG